jgi:hypothetical protein
LGIGQTDDRTYLEFDEQFFPEVSSMSTFAGNQQLDTFTADSIGQRIRVLRMLRKLQISNARLSCHQRSISLDFLRVKSTGFSNSLILVKFLSLSAPTNRSAIRTVKAAGYSPIGGSRD